MNRAGSNIQLFSWGLEKSAFKMLSWKKSFAYFRIISAIFYLASLMPKIQSSFFTSGYIYLFVFPFFRIHRGQRENAPHAK